MAGSVANSAKATGSGVTVLSTVGFTSTTGSTFVIGVSQASGQGTTTPSDSKGNSYTQIGTTQTNGSGSEIRWWYSQNGTGGAGHTATINWASGADPTMFFVELVGVATASFDSGSVGQQADANPPWTATSGTLAQADSIVLALVGCAFSGTFTESSGFTIQREEGNNSLYWTGAIASVVVSATTARTPSFTISGGGSDASVAVVAFKAAAAGGVTGTAAWTEANDVAALTGSATVSGTSAWTEANDAAALSGTVGTSATGSLAWTEANDGAVLTGVATVSGSSSWTEANDAAAITGQVAQPATGTIAWVEADDIAALTGTSAAGVQLLGGGPGGPRKRHGTESYLERLLGRPLDESDPEPEEIEVIEQAAEVAAKAPESPKHEEAAQSLRMLALKEAYVEIFLELEQKKRQAREEEELMAVIAMVL